MSTMDYYKVFYSVVKNGSITAAAQELFMTQPSASYAVKQLEEQLGVQLLVRKAKGARLTEEGAVLFGYVEQALGMLQAGEHKLEEMKSLSAGTVRLGASDSLCKYVLLPFLDTFRKSHPGIRICLSHGRSEHITKQLAEGRIDGGIVHLPAEEPVRIMATRTIQDCFVTGPAFGELLDSPVPVSQLIRYPFVALSAQSRTRLFLNGLLQLHGIELTPDIEVGSIDLLLEFVRKGVGIAFVTKSFVGPDLDGGTLREIAVAEPIPARSIGVVTMPGRSLSRAAAYFMEELAAYLRAAD